jgi:pyruvate/2-oxoglutarate/acetoin dehydrogenase E1 component
MTTVLASLNAALHDALRDDAAVLLLGEDIADPYGGAFKVTSGLSTAFPDRVLTTPISEAGAVAVATGLAMRGFKPVVEIMFGDFLFLAGDQIVNHAAKYKFISNGRIRVPLVVRAPMGGRRGYGPTHSQSLEKHFLGVPDLWVVAPHPLADPGALLRQAIDWPDPVLFVENKTGYAHKLIAAVPGYDIAHVADPTAPFPTTVLMPQAALDGLLICYGGLAPLALEALAHLRDREHLHFGLVIPSQLSPMPTSHLDAMLREHDPAAIVTVEEAPPAGGWGAEIVATVTQLRETQDRIVPRLRRVGARDTAIPSSRDLEYETLPQTRDIIAAALDCF